MRPEQRREVIAQFDKATMKSKRVCAGLLTVITATNVEQAKTIVYKCSREWNLKINSYYTAVYVAESRGTPDYRERHYTSSFSPYFIPQSSPESTSYNVPPQEVLLIRTPNSNVWGKNIGCIAKTKAKIKILF